MNDTGVKQQIVDSIKNADTVLVTVGQNPSVDELTAALGTTLYLNEIGKHATSVVSGAIPPAITFLKPEKVFEDSVDSLRDFVIALDKEKADHLRYKVDGDVVKIFITPYKTIISQKDLDFSQGDYNVEMVLAFGVKNQDDLDKALSAHGRILHDAAVATVGLEPSTLGTMDWSNDKSSSLSEMAAELAETLLDETKPMTEQVASALLTGIVAATDRFSNDKTTSRSMTVAAQLMARGANQQLIAAKLREGSKLSLPEGANSPQISKGESQSKSNNKKKSKKRDGNGLNITHDAKKNDRTEDEAKPPKQPETQAPAPAKKPEQSKDAPRVVDAPKDNEPYDPAAALDAALKRSDEIRQEDKTTEDDELARQLEAAVGSQKPATTPGPSTAEIEKSLQEEAQQSQADNAQQIGPVQQPVTQKEAQPEPGFGGTLNATTEQAAESKRLADNDNRNKTILSHGPNRHVKGDKPMFDAPFNGAGLSGEPPSIDPFKNIQTTSAETVAPPAAAPQPEAQQPQQPQPAESSAAAEQQTPTLAQLDQQHREAEAAAPAGTAQDAALNDVQAALEAAPATATPVPPAPGAAAASAPVNPIAPEFEAPIAPPPPPTPDFSQLPPVPQMPDFTQLPTAPGQDPNLPPDQPLVEMLPPAPQQSQPAAPADPGQFKIPGQQ